MQMTPIMLRRICSEVWGYAWEQELARVLGVHRGTVWRWQAGRTRMSTAHHYAVQRAALAHSKARYQHVREMVARVKSPKHTEVSWRLRLKKKKNPIPPWKERQ